MNFGRSCRLGPDSLLILRGRASRMTHLMGASMKPSAGPTGQGGSCLLKMCVTLRRLVDRWYLEAAQTIVPKVIRQPLALYCYLEIIHPRIWRPMAAILPMEVVLLSL